MLTANEFIVACTRQISTPDYKTNVVGDLILDCYNRKIPCNTRRIYSLHRTPYKKSVRYKNPLPRLPKVLNSS
jgi:hypothetical protein